MPHVLLRHYRRFGLFSFGMACLSLSMVARSEVVLSQSGHLLTFFGALLMYLLVAFVLYLVKPGQRGILEIAGASALVTTVVHVWVPSMLPAASAFFALMVFFAVLTLSWYYLKSEAAARRGKRITWRDRHSCDIPYPAKLIWRHIIPGAAPASDHCSRFVERYIPDPEDDDGLTVLFKPRRSGQAEYHLTFLEHDAPHFCRFHFYGNEADGTVVDGVFSVTLAVTEREHCTVIANEERSGLPLGHLVERWFDDVLGFQHDRLLALLNERYADGSGVTKPIAHPAE